MLNEAEAADERCHRLLPTMWTTPPGVLRSVAAALRGPLQLMIEHQGDSLLAPRGRAGAAIERRITVALSRDFEAAVSPAMQAFPGEHEENCTCSGCGERQTTVRKCSGCYQAQYCRCALFCCPSLTPSCPRDPPPAPAHPMIVPPPCPHNTPPQPTVHPTPTNTKTSQTPPSQKSTSHTTAHTKNDTHTSNSPKTYRISHSHSFGKTTKKSDRRSGGRVNV